MWFENISRYHWVAHLSFGNHSIYDFEVYLDTVTNELVAMCHEDPEEIESIEQLVEFSKDYTDDQQAQDDLYKLLLDHGMDQLLGWKKVSG